MRHTSPGPSIKDYICEENLSVYIALYNVIRQTWTATTVDRIEEAVEKIKTLARKDIINGADADRLIEDIWQSVTKHTKSMRHSVRFKYGDVFRTKTKGRDHGGRRKDIALDFLVYCLITDIKNCLDLEKEAPLWDDEPRRIAVYDIVLNFLIEEKILRCTMDEEPEVNNLSKRYNDLCRRGESYLRAIFAFSGIDFGRNGNQLPDILKAYRAGVLDRWLDGYNY